jgi:c-di-GMP-related signal transduction protein
MRPAPPAPDHEVFLGRQPILDRDGNVAAYELLFRSGQANRATVVDDRVATATVINHAFANLGLESVLGELRGFINFDEKLLMSDLVELLPRAKVVIELLETVPASPAVLRRVRTLRDEGFLLALDDYVGDREQKEPLFRLVDVVKVEITGFAPDELQRATGELRRHPVQLLAEKVDTREQVERCRRLGFELFQGYYFAKPVILSSRRVPPATQAILRLVGLVVADAESPQIEAIFRENPDLTVNLLRVVNSVAVGARQRIDSLKHALVVLGRNQLNRWLQILVYAVAERSGAKHPSPLTVLASTRGRVMEMLATAVGGGPSYRERAFMTGMLSLTDTLLGIPLAEILKPLPLALEVSEALLERKGQLGDLLKLCEALEQGGAAGIVAAVRPLPGLDAETVNKAQTEAMAWADSLGR